MKNIKTYEDFVNEEVNLRKGLIGAALGASLLANTGCGPSETEKYYARKNAEYQSQVDFDNQMAENEQEILKNQKNNIKSITLPVEILNIPSGYKVESLKNDIVIYYTNSFSENENDNQKFINFIDQNIKSIIDGFYIDLSNIDKSEGEYEFEIKVKSKYNDLKDEDGYDISYFFENINSIIINSDDNLSKYLKKLDMTPGTDKLEMINLGDVKDDNGIYFRSSSINEDKPGRFKFKLKKM